MSHALIRRRSLMKRLGAAGFLAAPVFREAFAEAAATPPLRLILLNLPGGIPFKGGSEEQLDTFFDTMLKPFAALQSDAFVFDNIQNGAGDLVSTYFELEGHGGGCRSIFGAAVMDQGCKGTASCGAEENAYRYGTATTIDQHLAKAIGSRTQFPALHFGTLWDKGQGGDHAECFFNNGQPVRPMADPMAAFTRLFGNKAPSANTGSTGPDALTVNKRARGKSRLDALYAEIAEVKAIAGRTERAKLDQHLTALRELETQLPAAQDGAPVPQKGTSCSTPSVTAAADIRIVSAAFNGLAYQALNCDLTRIVALQWLSSGDHLPRFEWLGCKTDHHTMEHSSNGAEYIKAQTWILEQMAAFVGMLKATPEGNGNMLDNSIVYLASEMGNGTHLLSPALSVMFGKAGGAFRPGRRIDMGGRHINDVLLTITKTMGLNASSIGDAKFNKGVVSLA
ncbi:MAG: DUF1552 domain-containing protein [Deltaproteobacteria bacterium]|nr:DUF1552 domain-containing protein [Deltaproteobacteria bacterium]